MLCSPLCLAVYLRSVGASDVVWSFNKSGHLLAPGMIIKISTTKFLAHPRYVILINIDFGLRSGGWDIDRFRAVLLFLRHTGRISCCLVGFCLTLATVSCLITCSVTSAVVESVYKHRSHLLFVPLLRFTMWAFYFLLSPSRWGDGVACPPCKSTSSCMRCAGSLPALLTAPLSTPPHFLSLPRPKSQFDVEKAVSSLTSQFLCQFKRLICASWLQLIFFKCKFSLLIETV